MKKLITFAIVMLLIFGLTNSSLSVVSIRSKGIEESIEEEYTAEFQISKVAPGTRSIQFNNGT